TVKIAIAAVTAPAKTANKRGDVFLPFFMVTAAGRLIFIGKFIKDHLRRNKSGRFPFLIINYQLSIINYQSSVINLISLNEEIFVSSVVRIADAFFAMFRRSNVFGSKAKAYLKRYDFGFGRQRAAHRREYLHLGTQPLRDFKCVLFLLCFTA